MVAASPFRAGVLWAADFLRQTAADALEQEPTDKGRPLCLTDAADKLKAAARRARPAVPGGLFPEKSAVKEGTNGNR